jgi:CRISPR-associated protein Cas2
MNRRLHLAAYDISDDSRLAAALRTVREYATGGQKSVHEVFVNERERKQLLSDIESTIDPATDSFMLVRLDSRLPVRTLGTATVPRDSRYFLVA